MLAAVAGARGVEGLKGVQVWFEEKRAGCRERHGWRQGGNPVHAWACLPCQQHVPGLSCYAVQTWISLQGSVDPTVRMQSSLPLCTGASAAPAVSTHLLSQLLL